MNLRRTAKLALGLLATTAMAQVGEPPPRSFLLDKTYGENGVADISWRTPGEVVVHSVPRPDGKVWVIGHSNGYPIAGFISRVLPTGAVDPSIASGGRVLLPETEGRDPVLPRTAATDNAGRLVSVWRLDRMEVMIRTLEDGTPDPTFGKPIEGFSWKGVKLGSGDKKVSFSQDGGIWLSDRYPSSGADIDLFGYRISEDGLTVSSYLGWGSKGSLALEADGDGVLIAGVNADGDLSLGRNILGPTGKLAPDYQFAGWLPENKIKPRTGMPAGRYTYPTFPPAADVVITNGKILVVWVIPRTTREGTESVAVVARFAQDGSLEPTFGTGGTIEVTLPFSESYQSDYYDSNYKPVRLLADSDDGSFYICGPGLHRVSVDGQLLSAQRRSLVPTQDRFRGLHNYFTGIWKNPVTHEISGFFPVGAVGATSSLHRFNADLTSSSQGVTFEANRHFASAQFSWLDPLEPTTDGGCFVNLQGWAGGLYAAGLYAEDGFTRIGSTMSRILRLRPDGSLDVTWGRLGHTDIADQGEAISMAADGKGGLWCLLKGNTLIRLSSAGRVETTTQLPSVSASRGLTEYLKVAMLPDGGVVCLGVNYTERQHLVAHRVTPTGDLDPEYGGVVHEIKSIFGDSFAAWPRYWSLSDPVVLKSGAVRVGGSTAYREIPGIYAQNNARVSHDFTQITQMNVRGKLDRSFGGRGVIHLPGLRTNYLVSMTKPNAAGVSFVGWNILSKDSRRYVVVGVGSGGSMFAVPSATRPGKLWGVLPGALTALSDGTLAQLDPSAHEVRFFDSRGRSLLGEAATASFDPPRWTFGFHQELLPSGDLFVGDPRSNALSRCSLDSVSVTPRTRIPTRNRTTGFHEQTLDITNTGSADLTGFRLLMSNITPGVHLWNASTAAAYPNQPVVEYLKPLAKGESITMTLQFTGGTRLAPRFHSTMVGSETVSAGAILKTERNPGKVSLVLATIPGSRYAPEYSDDNGLTWKTAAKAILAAGTRTAWVDKGKPQTALRPPLTRKYRFVSVVE